MKGQRGRQESSVSVAHIHMFTECARTFCSEGLNLCCLQVWAVPLLFLPGSYGLLSLCEDHTDLEFEACILVVWNTDACD